MRNLRAVVVCLVVLASSCSGLGGGTQIATGGDETPTPIGPNTGHLPIESTSIDSIDGIDSDGDSIDSDGIDGIDGIDGDIDGDDIDESDIGDDESDGDDGRDGDGERDDDGRDGDGERDDAGDDDMDDGSQGGDSIDGDIGGSPPLMTDPTPVDKPVEATAPVETSGFPPQFDRCARSQDPVSAIQYEVSGQVADYLAERTGPSIDYEQIGKLLPGQRYEFVDCRHHGDTAATWWRRPQGGWSAAEYLMMTDPIDLGQDLDEGAGQPTPESDRPVNKQRAAEALLLESGTILCVSGVATDDVLNVRTGPTGDDPIVGRLRPDSCGVRTLGETQGGWLRIASFAAGSELSVVYGWASSNFLEPASEVDSAEAAAMGTRFVPTAHGAVDPPMTRPCRSTGDGRVACQVSTWFWIEASSLCNSTGRAGWKIESSGDITVERSDGRWTITEQFVLVLDC